MGRYNRILVAVDGSPASKNALEQVFKLARDKGKWIIAVAINPLYKGDIDLSGVRNINEVLTGRGEEILTEVRERANIEGVTIKTRLENGEIYEKIIDVAEEEGCDLIAMGRRGMSRIERALMGSVTARVIGHFKGRILVVPRDTTLGWENILVATDGSKYSEPAVEEAVNNAKSYGGALKIVRAVNVTEEFQVHAPGLVEKLINEAKEGLEGIRNNARQAGVDTEIFVREGEPYKVIVKLAEQLNAGVIVMGSHGRTGLRRIFMGSVTARVIGHSHCPVLVLTG